MIYSNTNHPLASLWEHECTLENTREQVGPLYSCCWPINKMDRRTQEISFHHSLIILYFSIKPPFLVCPVKLVLSIFLTYMPFMERCSLFFPASVRITRQTCCADLKLYCVNTNYYCVVMLSLTFEEIVSLCVSNFNYQVLTVIDMFLNELLCFLYHKIPLMLSQLAFLFSILFSGKKYEIGSG